MRRRWSLTLSLVAAFAVIAAGAVLWQAVELSSLTAVAARVDLVKPLLSGLRFALIGALALLWPWLPALRPRSGGDQEAMRIRWMALRWRVVGWLLVMELLIGQNLLGRFVRLTVHPA